MLLAIDIGNTNIVMGCLDGEKTVFVERLSTDWHKTDTEYALYMKNIFELKAADPAKVTGCIISSVVPQLTEQMAYAAEKFLHKTPKIIGPGLKTGLNIKIDNPSSLGSDLIVGAVAALNEYPAPLVVVDLGTATTFSIIDQKRQYIGAIFLPGVRTALDSLVKGTSLLPNIRLEEPKKVVGSNTIDAMKSGAIYGTAAQIDGLVERIWEYLGEPCKVIATGGLAHAIIPHCKHGIHVDDDLMLKGLRIIHEKNR